MSIPTYNEAKGRHVSHGAIYATGGVRSVNGRPVFQKHKTKLKKKKRLESQSGFRKMLGKIPKGYVLEDVLVFSVSSEAYVAVCEGFCISTDNGKPNLFIKAYTKCKENSSLYYFLSKKIKESREELVELTQNMKVGKLRVGSTSWNDMYSEARRIMTAPPMTGNYRVSQIAMYAFGRKETLKRKNMKRMAKLESDGIEENSDT